MEFLILAGLGAWLAFALRSCVRRKGGCGRCCDGCCTGCKQKT